MFAKVGEVWIVLDALDECSTRRGHATEGLLSWIKDLVNSLSNVHILMTSRQEHDIEEGLRAILDEDELVSIQSDLINEDINAYILNRVKKSEALKRWRKHEDIQEEIETALMKKANGM